MYKTKPVLNFNDLCLIYGYTVADGRYSMSSHDLGFEDEINGVNIGVFFVLPKFLFYTHLNLGLVTM